MSSLLGDKQPHGRVEWLLRKGRRKPRVSRKLCPGFGQHPKDREGEGSGRRERNKRRASPAFWEVLQPYRVDALPAPALREGLLGRQIHVSLRG